MICSPVWLQLTSMDSFPSLFALASKTFLTATILPARFPPASRPLPARFQPDLLQRCKVSAKPITCVSKDCDGRPDSTCGLCALPLCTACLDEVTTCDQCKVVICDRCDDPCDNEHREVIDTPTLNANLGLTKPPRGGWPEAGQRISLTCTVCAKRHCWMCWQAFQAKERSCDPMWMCDACGQNACMFCVEIVRLIEG